MEIRKPWSEIFIFKFLSLEFKQLTTHDTFKFLLFQAYILQHNYGTTCLSETLLNFSIESNDDRISADGYNLIKLDRASDLKRVGVCIYYKEPIPLLQRDNICILDNCLVTGIRFKCEIIF